MAKISAPLVNHDKLGLGNNSTSINVGSKAWFNWLEKNSSFHYESIDGKFTACKESRTSGMFWYANRRVGGKLRRCYIGSTKDLSLEKLLAIAKKLSGTNQSYQKKQSYTANSCVTKTCQTNRAIVDQLRKEILDLQKQLDHERTINAGLQSEIQHTLSSPKVFEASRVNEVDLSNIKIYQLHKHRVIRLKDLEAAGYHFT
jgi:hypothetical protein